MVRLLVVAWVLLLAPFPARAGSLPIPDFSASIVPPYLELFACESATPGTWDTLSVIGTGLVIPGAYPQLGNQPLVLRDIALNPLPGLPVDIVFCDDYRLYSPYPDPRATVDCTLRRLHTTSGPDGSVHVALLGAGRNGLPRQQGGTLCGTGCSCVHIYAQYVEITPMSGIPCVAYDEDGGAGGMAGVGVQDLSAWLWDCGHLGAACSCRSDFNHDGTLSSGDLSRLLKICGLGHSAHSAGTLCP